MFATQTNPLLALRLTATKAVESSFPWEASESIAELTRLLAAGDEAAFRQFHERYFDRLYHFLLVVARGQEAEAAGGAPTDIAAGGPLRARV